jgi:hypothetical protein
MNYVFQTSTCALLLLLTHCRSSFVEMDTSATTQQSLATSTSDDPPDCSADGICRITQCDNDPDCSDLSDGDHNDHPAPAATWALTGSISHTSISGFAGTEVHTLGVANSDVNAVYALLSRERSDDPCYFAIGTENVNNAALDAAPIVDLCGSNGPTSSYLHADYLDIDAAGSGDHNFISGVVVCMNRNDDKVKGISVVGKKLMSDGTLVSLSVLGSPPRPNCDGWESWSQCPAGQIATAVDAHFATGNTFRSLTGIALQCRAVTP